MRIGFTGSRLGMTDEQVASFKELLIRLIKDNLGLVTLSHGDCVGSDEKAHEIALLFNIPVFVYPPLNPSLRAFCKNYCIRYVEKNYLDRDRDIVTNTDILIATPNTRKNSSKSGTWYTVRYAKKMGKNTYIIYPEGDTEFWGTKKELDKK